MATEPDAEQLHDRPLGELVKRLSEEASLLVRKEIELAKAELGQKAKEAGAGAGLFSAAAFLGFFAFACVTAAIVLALSLVFRGWLAALIVALVYAALAAILALVGRGFLQRANPPVPEQTVETLREDMQWLKSPRRSGVR